MTEEIADAKIAIISESSKGNDMKSLREMFYDLFQPEPVKIITPFGQNTVLPGVSTEDLDQSIREMLDGIKRNRK